MLKEGESDCVSAQSDSPFLFLLRHYFIPLVYDWTKVVLPSRVCKITVFEKRGLLFCKVYVAIAICRLWKLLLEDCNSE